MARRPPRPCTNPFSLLFPEEIAMKQEQIILNEGGRYPLKGMLTLPEGTGPFPAVVLVHGSGSSNMDEKVGKMTPFRDLAEGLAAWGIASLRYDKRSFAHGFKMLRDKSTVITVREETIEDAIAAAKLLKENPRIDRENVFLIGHSMGGMLAPRIDAEGGDCRGLILMAGTPRTLEEVLKDQVEEQLSQMPALVRKLSEKKMRKLLEPFDGLYQLTDEEAIAKKFGGGTTLYYFKEMGEHPARDYLLSTEKPILVMQGGKDFQAKADVDFKAYQELLKNRPNTTFRLYENLNHCFVPAIYTQISKAKQEYNVEQHIGPEVIGDIARWIRDNRSVKPY
jgi:dienelactone hydrolase